MQGVERLCVACCFCFPLFANKTVRNFTSMRQSALRRWLRRIKNEIASYDDDSFYLMMMNTVILRAKISGGIWILGSFILMQLFTQDLKANMVVKAPTMRINSMEDIVEKQWLEIAYPIQSPIGSILETTPGEFGAK